MMACLVIVCLNEWMKVNPGKKVYKACSKQVWPWVFPCPSFLPEQNTVFGGQSRAHLLHDLSEALNLSLDSLGSFTKWNNNVKSQGHREEKVKNTHRHKCAHHSQHNAWTTWVLLNWKRGAGFIVNLEVRPQTYSMASEEEVKFSRLDLTASSSIMDPLKIQALDPAVSHPTGWDLRKPHYWGYPHVSPSKPWELEAAI